MVGKRVRSAKGRALLLTAAVAVAALFTVPAHAALAPGQVELAGLAADGFLNASDVVTDGPNPSVPVHWIAPAGFEDANDTMTSSFQTDAATIPSGCGPFAGLGQTSTSDDYGYLNTTCFAAFADGSTIHWVVTWTDGDTATPVTAEDTVIKDVTVNTPVITAPAEGRLYNITPKNASGNLASFAGTASPFDAVHLYDVRKFAAPAVPLRTATTPKVEAVATADANGVWSIDVDIRSLGSGTQKVVATVVDAAGNAGVTAVRTFDLDVDQPNAYIDTPANQTVFAQTDQIVLSGEAHDPNTGNAYDGVTAVQVNVYNPASVRPGQVGPSPVVVGSYIVQDAHAVCADCAATANRTGAGRDVTFTMDLSFLGPGAYTINVVPYDKAGNAAAQPATVNIIKI